MDIKIGAKIMAYDSRSPKFYPATIIDIKPPHDHKQSEWRVLVHYDGWKSKWDSWIPANEDWIKSSSASIWRDGMSNCCNTKSFSWVKEFG